MYWWWRLHPGWVDLSDINGPNPTQPVDTYQSMLNILLLCFQSSKNGAGVCPSNETTWKHMLVWKNIDKHHQTSTSDWVPWRMQADPLPLETLRMMQYQAWAANGMLGGVGSSKSQCPKFHHFSWSLFTCVYHYSKVWRSIFIFSILRLGMLCSYPLVSWIYHFDIILIRKTSGGGGRGFVGHGFVESISLRVDSLNIHSIYSNPGLRY